MKTDEIVMPPRHDRTMNPDESGRHVRWPRRVLKSLVCILAAVVLLAAGLFSGLGFLDSFEPSNGAAWKVLFGALTCGLFAGAVALVRCGMNKSAEHCSVGARSREVKSWALAIMALVMAGSAKCSADSPDPLLASGEQALVGAYKIDNVLLAPGKLVLLQNNNLLFGDMGDTPEQAAQKGLLNATQLAVLKRQDCTMTILADHGFVITNLPSVDLTQSFSVKGTWFMQVYHVFDTYGYRITLKFAGYKGPTLRAKFFNADKPNPPILEIFYGDGGKMFRFAKANWRAGSRRAGTQ